MMVTREIHEGKLNELILPDGCYTIGRSVNNSLVIDDNTISACHVKITVFFKSAYIEDMDSTNGMTVNGKKIAKSILYKGDRFQVSQYHFVVAGFESE